MAEIVKIKGRGSLIECRKRLNDRWQPIEQIICPQTGAFTQMRWSIPTRTSCGGRKRCGSGHSCTFYGQLNGVRTTVNDLIGRHLYHYSNNDRGVPAAQLFAQVILGFVREWLLILPRPSSINRFELISLMSDALAFTCECAFHCRRTGSLE